MTKSLVDFARRIPGWKRGRSMHWYRMDVDRIADPAVDALSEALSVERLVVLGALCALEINLTLADESGQLGSRSDSVIGRWAEWPVDRRGAFAAALRATGWIDEAGKLRGWALRHKHTLTAAERETARTHERKHRASAPATEHHITEQNIDASKEASRAVARCAPTEPQLLSDVEKLFGTYCEATGRDPARFVLNSKRSARLAELIGWAGSLEAAQRGVRKVGASAWHRGENPDQKRYDGLESKPFRTAESFLGWCEETVASPARARAPETETRREREKRELRSHMEKVFLGEGSAAPSPALSGGAES